MPDVKSTVTTTREYQATLSRAEIVAMLKRRTNAFPYNVPANATVSVIAPNGAYCAGDVLHIDDVGGLIVCWTETEVK